VQVTREQIGELKEKSKKVFFKSSFSFLNCHRSYRPGAMHLLIGVSGGGKSTATRSLMLDVIEENPDKKVLIWLSEESKEDYFTEFAQDEIIDFKVFENMTIISEIDIIKKYGDIKPSDLFKNLEVQIPNYDIVFLDNITTSNFYAHGNPREQTQVVLKLKGFCSANKKPLVIMAHTAGGVTENNTKILDPNDIRGNKTIVNVSEFLYILQMFQIGESRCSTIRIQKHRSQNVDNRFYRFVYSSMRRRYTHDVRIQFSEFKKLFKMRDQL
jgi:KaiC/GvpD/RAD55 family RecA-like ATPase